MAAPPPRSPARPAAKPGSNARDADAEDGGAPPPPPKKSTTKLVLIVATAIVLALAIGGGAAWFFMKDSAEEPAATAAATPAAEKGKAKAKESPKNLKPPVFVNLEPFTVNLTSEGSDRYLQTTIVLQMSDDKAAESIKVYMPVIRNKVLMVLSGKRPSEIDSGEGKQKLTTEIVAAAREAVPGSTAANGTTGVLFSSFVIQ